MTTAWILVADSSRAQLFSLDRPRGALQPLRTFDNEDARAHERELTTDLPGRAFDSHGMGRHVMEQNVEPKRQAAIAFAKRIVAHLEAGRKRGAFAHLYVLAAPGFLGLLRKAYTPALAGMLAAEMDKDLTRSSVEEIRAYLPRFPRTGATLGTGARVH